MSQSEGRLPDWNVATVVIAHPDDESFGLGAIIDEFVRAGTTVTVLCFTQGEASTLGTDVDDLGAVRAGELADAARVLGVIDVELHGFPDGGLNTIEPVLLSDSVIQHVERHQSQGLLVFDPSGITGHPDHQAATRAAGDAARQLGLPVLAWSLPADVAQTLRAETGAPFEGQAPGDLDLRITVSRIHQREAVSCHPSQAVPSSALWRRLALLGDREHLMWLRR